MVNYQNGKIYKIVNSVNDMIYIGSTTLTLSRRMAEHRCAAKRNKRQSNFYQSMRTVGVDKFFIILLELYPCSCKDELEAKEFEIMNSFDKSNLYNSMFDGKPSEEVRQKISENLKGNEKITGKNNYRFDYGSVALLNNRWRFCWRKDHKNKYKYFGFVKYGPDNAKWLAEQYRFIVYPELEEQALLLPNYFD